MNINRFTRRTFLRTSLAAGTGALAGSARVASQPAATPEWALGPFASHREPLLEPTPDSLFKCPVRGKEVRWEERNVYNPAAAVRDGKVHLLYRADDISRDLGWGRTCRIGLVTSEDGVHFTRHPEPAVYPDNDEWKQYEWEKRGFVGNTTVANGMVPFKGKWMLYYGAADRVIGMATCEME